MRPRWPLSGRWLLRGRGACGSRCGFRCCWRLPRGPCMWAIACLTLVAGLRKPAQHTLRERHQFHWRFRRALLPMAIAAACAAAGIIFAFMPPVARARDSVLAAAALAYFSGVHSGRTPWQFPLRWPRSFPGKEFLVGVLFTAGCVLPAWHRPHALAAPGSAMWVFWIPALAFAALAWLNCSCIERWEGVEGSAHCDGRSPQSMRSIALALFTIFFLLCVLAAASTHPRPAALLAAGATSALLLALLDRHRARFSALALRAAADLVLLTPLVLLSFAGLFNERPFLCSALVQNPKERSAEL